MTDKFFILNLRDMFAIESNNFFLYLESTYNGYTPFILILFSLTAIICGILVITSVNPIIAVLFLIGLFLSIAAYLIILGINFIGLSYLLVYVGAVSILFLFILMLINVRISELCEVTNKSIPLSIATTVLFNSIIWTILPYNLNTSDYISIYSNIKEYLLNKSFNYAINMYDIYNNIIFVTSSSWDSNLGEIGHITSLGNVMYTNYSIWLILTSVILLLAMVGAIIITISPYKVNLEDTIPKPYSFINSSLHNGFDPSDLEILVNWLLEIADNNPDITKRIWDAGYYIVQSKIAEYIVSGLICTGSLFYMISSSAETISSINTDPDLLFGPLKVLNSFEIYENTSKCLYNGAKSFHELIEMDRPWYANKIIEPLRLWVYPVQIDISEINLVNASRLLTEVHDLIRSATEDISPLVDMDLDADDVIESLEGGLNGVGQAINTLTRLPETGRLTPTSTQYFSRILLELQQMRAEIISLLTGDNPSQLASIQERIEELVDHLQYLERFTQQLQDRLGPERVVNFLELISRIGRGST